MASGTIKHLTGLSSPADMELATATLQQAAGFARQPSHVVYNSKHDASTGSHNYKRMAMHSNASNTV
jgi:hypothetical protein